MVRADVKNSLPIRYTPKVAGDNNHKIDFDEEKEDYTIKPTQKLILLRGTAKTGGVTWAKVMTEDGRVGWVNKGKLTRIKATPKHAY